MGVKWSALTFGCVMGVYFFVEHLPDLEEGGLSFSEWLGTICFSVAVAVSTTWVYYHLQHHLHKKGLSLHDDSDFEDD